MKSTKNLLTNDLLTLRFGKLLNLGSQDIADALRNTLTIIVPFALLFYLKLPVAAVGIGTGTLLICLTDLSGSRSEKLWSAWLSIIVFFSIATLTAFAVANHFILALATGIFSLLLLLLSAFGQRLAVIGSMGMVVATFTIGLQPSRPWEYGLFIALGGLWYYIVSLIQIWLFPYHPLKRAISKTKRDTAALMRLRAMGYDPQVSLSGFNSKNIKLHNKITNGHELIRRLLLGDGYARRDKDLVAKQFLQESLVLIDLYEQVSAVHYDYMGIRKRLNESGALELIKEAIQILADSVEGKNVERETVGQSIKELENIADVSIQNEELLNGLISNLRETYLLVFSLSEKPNVEHLLNKGEFSQFLTEGRFSMSKLQGHLNFDSAIFRFALRMGILMSATVFLIGFLPKGNYGYWLPLTLIVVSRPSYGLTMKRNIERLSGTLVGLCVGCGLLLLNLSAPLQLLLAVLSLFVFFAFFFARYLVSAMGITLAVILCLSIYRGHAGQILSDRLLFTVLGCVIGLMATFVFPIRLSVQLKTVLTNTLVSNISYFRQVVEGDGAMEVKLARKHAYLTLASLTDTLMLLAKEPRSKRKDLGALKEIELLCFQLNALIAAAPSAGLAGQVRHNYPSILEDLELCVKQINLMPAEALFKLAKLEVNADLSLGLGAVVSRLKGYFSQRMN